MNYTSKAGFPYPSVDATGWHTPIQRFYVMADGIKSIGDLAVKPSSPGDPEPLPSTNLKVDVASGTWVKTDWSVQSYAGSTENVLTAASTNYLYLTDSGTLTINTSGFPAATNIVRIAVVATDATKVTAIVDARIAGHFSIGGTALGASYILKAGDTLADGANYALGTTTGTKIGTATTQKIGFFNATPVVQQAQTVDMKDLLVTFGLMASAAGATPLDLDGGAATLGDTLFEGNITIDDGLDIEVGTTSGTMIGTGPTELLGFFGATPVVQPGNTTDLKDALENLGLIGTGGATHLDLDDGDITAGFLIGLLYCKPQTLNTTSTISNDTALAMVDASGASCVITLPSAAFGRLLFIKRLDSSGNSITLSAIVSQTIDGSTTNATLLAGAKSGCVLVGDAVDQWHILGSF